MSFLFLTLFIYERHKEKKSILSLLLLGLWIAIPLCAILISKTASEAYIPMLFPAIILSIAFVFNYIYKLQALIAVILILLFVITNSYLLITKNYLMGTKGGYGLPFSKKLSISKEIIKKSNGKEYNIIGKGKEYEYLLWWLGKPLSKND
jgi:hypothetical protein